jgi:PPOX class probable F420-dependent enzyme
MDIDEARAVAAEQHRAVLATMRRDGSPQMSPVLVTVAGDGRLIVSSRQPAFKVRNLRRDPRVWLCVLSDTFFGRWIQVEGTAELVDLPEAMDLLVEYYRSIAGEHPDWDDYRSAMQRERRVAILIEPTRVGPDRSG